MRSVLRIINDTRKSETGFVLIVALMATLIMIAVGFFALTVTTQDVRIAGRVIGERRALSAAESGVHAVLMQLNPATPVSYTAQIDPAGDPGISYTTSVPQRNNAMPTISMPGFDLSRAYVGSVFDTVVTGLDNNYGTTARIAIGSAYAPNPSDTQQGNQ
jgi:Tfp pilus assembly protein PilX